MKKSILLLLLSLFLFSCSKEERIDPNPKSLQRVITNPGEPEQKQFYFNALGLLEKIVDAKGMVIQTFEYNWKNQLIKTTYQINEGYPSTTKTIQDVFAYNIFGLIEFVNGERVNFDATTNTYTFESKNQGGFYEYIGIGDQGILNWFPITKTTVQADNEGLFEKKHQVFTNELYGTFSSIELDIYGIYFKVLKANVINPADYNPFKEVLKPLFPYLAFSRKSNTIDENLKGYNFKNITTFENKPSDLKDLFFDLTSESGHRYYYEPEDPERWRFIYEYNQNNLPTKQIREDYYFKDLEGSRTTALYYYQGDIIP